MGLCLTFGKPSLYFFHYGKRRKMQSKHPHSTIIGCMEFISQNKIRTRSTISAPYISKSQNFDIRNIAHVPYQPTLDSPSVLAHLQSRKSCHSEQKMMPILHSCHFGILSENFAPTRDLNPRPLKQVLWTVVTGNWSRSPRPITSCSNCQLHLAKQEPLDRKV